MVSKIRILLDKDKVDAATVSNLHRFGERLSLSLRSSYLPTEAQIEISVLIAEFPMWGLYPAYPLGPDGTLSEMLAGRLDSPVDTSWDFFVTFHATCTKEQKDGIILQLLGSKYIKTVKDCHGYTNIECDRLI